MSERGLPPPTDYRMVDGVRAQLNLVCLSMSVGSRRVNHFVEAKIFITWSVLAANANRSPEYGIEWNGSILSRVGFAAEI